MLTPLMVAPINILGLILKFFLPKNDNFYHNNIVFAEKVKNKQKLPDQIIRKINKYPHKKLGLITQVVKSGQKKKRPNLVRLEAIATKLKR